MEWYWTKNGQKQGPISTAQLKQLAQDGQLRATDMIWRNGLPKWVPASKANGLIFARVEVPVQDHSVSPPALTEVKIPPLELKDESVGVAPVGSTRPCPFCAEPIAQAAIKCKHCGEFLVANGNSGGIQSGPRTDTANSASGQAPNLSLIQALAYIGCLLAVLGLLLTPLLSLVGFIWAVGLHIYMSSAKITKGRSMTVISIIASGLGLILWKLLRD